MLAAPDAGKDVEQWELLLTTGGSTNGAATLGESLSVTTKLDVFLAYNASISLLK
jgi:hypothetical protein